MPPDCRGNRILALPPARKGKQGSDMVDKCAPRPWARAQSQPPRGEKIKSILLLTIMCNLFAHRHTPDTHTKQTRKTNNKSFLRKTTSQHLSLEYYSMWIASPYTNRGARSHPP